MKPNEKIHRYVRTYFKVTAKRFLVSAIGWLGLCLSPRASLRAFEIPADAGLAPMQGVGPIEGAPVIAMDAPPMLISNPSATEAYRCENRTCTGVPEFTNIKAELARALPTTNTAPLNVKKRKGQ